MFESYEVQDQNETAREQWEHEMQSPERQEYSDRAEAELALIEGWDPFSGMTPTEYLSRFVEESLDLDVPTLEEIGL